MFKYLLEKFARLSALFTIEPAPPIKPLSLPCNDSGVHPRPPNRGSGVESPAQTIIIRCECSCGCKKIMAVPSCPIMPLPKMPAYKRMTVEEAKADLGIEIIPNSEAMKCWSNMEANIEVEHLLGGRDYTYQTPEQKGYVFCRNRWMSKEDLVAVLTGKRILMPSDEELIMCVGFIK